MLFKENPFSFLDVNTKEYKYPNESDSIEKVEYYSFYSMMHKS
jgi:hypothetical protein